MTLFVDAVLRFSVNKPSATKRIEEKLIPAAKGRAYVLWHIAKFGFSTRARIVSGGHLSPRTVTRCLRDLEDQRLIERKGKSVVLTSPGRGLLEKVEVAPVSDPI